MAHSPEFERFTLLHVAAVRDGLLAAAYVYRNAVMVKLSGGYTSGLYKRGNVMNSVHVGPIHIVEGVQFLEVGTDVPYAAYWEFGFNQRVWVWYSQKLGRWVSVPPSKGGPTRFVRVEHWRNALNECGENMSNAFGRAYIKRLEAGT